MRNALRIGIGVLLVAMTVSACGKKEEPKPAAVGAANGAAPGTAPDSGAAAVATSPFASSPGAPAPVPVADSSAAPGAESGAAPDVASAVPAVLSRADVDAYRRGQEAELARIEKILTDMGAAKDEAEKEALLEQLNDRMASEEEGARAARMEIPRYQAVSATIEDMIVRWRRSMLVSRMAADTTRIATLPPERQAQLRAAIAAARTPYAGLPPATVDAVGPRVAELDSLHVITGALVNQALRAAKAGPDAGGGEHPGHP